jgi:two-component system CheB/CheR fusion protein
MARKKTVANQKGARIKQGHVNKKLESRRDFPVIGIGASAGGLEAFSTLFKRMPVDTGMAFILIQHIEPSHVGNMVGLIQRQTRMPVIEVKDDGIKVEPNHLYMIPQNREISIVDGTLKLEAEVDSRVSHSIDLFFRSLADDLRDRAICVILSGTGSDGTAGARAVKAETGLVVVQDPEEAGYDGMPRSAIDAGVADMVLPAEDMAEKLIEYVKGAYGRPAERRREALEKSSDLLKQVFSLIKSRTRRDFSGYKVSTINRRIERRMTINRVQELETYVRLLREDPDEVQELIKDTGHQLLPRS